MGRFLGAVKLATCMPGIAFAHVSEQGFVLLLPTDIYITAGVAVVALTVLALAILPEQFGVRALRVRRFAPVEGRGAATVLSLICLSLLSFMLWIGLNGPRDPLSNLMPLGFWTLGWIALISMSGIIGNIWAWVNPWRGIYAVLGSPKPLMRLPDWVGWWPASLLLVGYTGFLLADVSPDDPARLASLVGGYFVLTLVGLIVFGPIWLHRAEVGHAIFASYGSLAPVSLSRGGVGVPGWQVMQGVAPVSAGVFAVVLLATGSFDGLNETFWWLGVIGVNPLEFPGRSAVVVPTVIGLLAAVIGLTACFSGTVWLGVWLARSQGQFRAAFACFARSLLPIAFVYHVAHYLPSFLVSIQYAIAALSDPLARGDDLLGLQPFYVTTGFFNVMDTVRVIWLTQAGLVVLGHVWSVILAHRFAVQMFPGARRAVLATLPLSAFMIAYTFLGLWLLAAPRGV